MNNQHARDSAFCIGCACHDLHACDVGCAWLRVEYQTARGVCSECEAHLARWDSGDRDLAVPVNDNLQVIGAAVSAAWNSSSKGRSAEEYIAGMLDVLHWLGELPEDKRDVMFESLKLAPPALPGWIAQIDSNSSEDHDG